jgi:ABC-type proline/glycine betaine transport system substrate-binding protein
MMNAIKSFFLACMAALALTSAAHADDPAACKTVRFATVG